MSTRAIIYGVSILVHAGIAAAVVRIHPPEITTPVVISIATVTPSVPPHPPPPPVVKSPEPEPLAPPPPKPTPVPKAPKAPTPAPAAAPPPTAAPPPPANAAPPPSTPVPEFGVELGGASGPGGIAVPLGDPHATPSATRRAAARELKAEPVQTADACTEPASKPKPIQVSQPAFPEEARAAGIQGRVRVELTVDTEGTVVKTKVVEGLGHGLDEAALEAARTYRFEPAQRCGKAVAATFTISVRFTL